jgi:hypothetical protein
MTKLLIFIIALMALPFQAAFAHPVAYKGAFALMTWNQSFLSDYWLVYSFRPDMGIAARAMRMTMDQGGDLVVYMPQFDYLVKRWNGDDFQANIYAYGGFGGARFQGQNGTAGLMGVEADAESRKYFALIKYEAMLPSVGQNFQQVEGRLGIAPYEAEYDEIASWFMIAGKYHPGLSKNYSITPLVRLFYKSVLLETGVSLQGDTMLNLMFHF